VRLLLVGGASGGHLAPGVAIARAWADRGGEARFLVGGDSLEDRLLVEEPFERSSLGMAGRGSGGPGRGLRLPAALLRAGRVVRTFRPAVVLGLGGLLSIPGAVAARAHGRTLALLEVNSVPGRATLALRRFAAAILVADEGLALRLGPSAVEVGVPVRAEAASSDRESARRRFGLDVGRPTLLVLGGSQGAEGLNRFVAAHGFRLGSAGFQVLHLAGPGKADPVRASLRAAGVRACVLEFQDAMGDAYAAADLVLCRGGASTLAEVALAGLPAVVVPYPHHRDRHQLGNAARLREGARAISESDLDAGAMAGLVRLLGDRGALVRMGEAARAASRPEAAARAVSVLSSIATARGERALVGLPATQEVRS
jgi:UDP-N-acetylglucosamine--N-acetylmuramyl-(pentapeptide) pyrophosphoryl-undecaprenol N-acetylglucosamine transferase